MSIINAAALFMALNTRKLSLHLMNSPNRDEVVALVKRLRPTVIKALDNGSYLAELDAMLAGQLDYQPLYVARFWWGSNNEPNNYQGQNFDQWRGIGEVASGLAQLAPHFRGSGRLYIESYNETGISPQYLSFEAQRAKRLYEDYGLRTLAASPAVGWTVPAHFDMARDAGLLSALQDYSGAWGEHGYFPVIGAQTFHGPYNQAAYPDGRFGREPIDIANDRRIYGDDVTSWLLFRCAMSHRWMKERGFDGDIIVNETGADDGGYNSYRNYTGGASVGGWKEAKPFWQSLGYLNGKTAEQFYGEQMAWQEAQAQAYPWLLGMTVFTYGSAEGSRWRQAYDIRGTDVYDRFLVALSGYNIPPVEPPPPPRPIPDLPASGCWLVTHDGNVNVRAAASQNAAIVRVIPEGTLVQSLGIVRQTEDPAREWHKIADGYVARWVVQDTNDCEFPDEDNGETQTMKLGIVARDMNAAQLQQAIPPYDADFFVQLGEPREATALTTETYTRHGVNADTGAAVEATADMRADVKAFLDGSIQAANVGPFIARQWIQKHAGEPGQDYVNGDVFMQHVTGAAADIVDKTLFEAVALKQYINAVQQYHYESTHVGETHLVLNENYSPNLYYELLNGDGVPLNKLPLFMQVQRIALQRLYQYIDPATNQPLFRNLKGAVINRDIGLDEDRAAFWRMAINQQLLNDVIGFDAVILLKRKVNAALDRYMESEVLPLEDMQILASEGYGSAQIVLQVEVAGGWQGKLSSEEMAAGLWLLAKSAAKYPNLSIVWFLRQAGNSGDWGNTHDIRGIAEDLYLQYQSGARTPPPIDWLPDSIPDPGDDEPPVEPGSGCLPFARVLARALGVRA